MKKKWFELEKNKWCFDELVEDPKTVLTNSTVAWKCKKCQHVWKTKLLSRLYSKSKCPKCSIKERKTGIVGVVSDYKDVLSEWDYVKNKENPNKCTAGGDKKYWWKCKKGHSWKAVVRNRTIQKKGCPYCSGNLVCKDNCLQTLRPEIAKMWHPSKNNDLTPRDVVSGSNRIVWWMCDKGHEWVSSVGSKTRNSTGCPHCNQRISGIEARFFIELNGYFHDALFRHKIDNKEFDIVIPSILLVVEIDGSYWHKDSDKKDLEKTNIANKNGYVLIRIREEPLKKKRERLDILYKTEDAKFDYYNTYISLITLIDELFSTDILSHYGDRYLCEEEFLKFKYSNLSLVGKKTIIDKLPYLKDEWDYDKNYPLIPESFTGGEQTVVWWRCKEGHCWKTSISNRAGKHNKNMCPYCQNKAVNSENSAGQKCKMLYDIWDYEKNDKTPDDYVYGSSKRVFLICSECSCSERYEIRSIIKGAISRCKKCRKRVFYE